MCNCYSRTGHPSASADIFPLGARVHKKEALTVWASIMQEKRLELSWYCYHTDLNRARLPIPPFLHASIIITASLSSVN